MTAKQINQALVVIFLLILGIVIYNQVVSSTFKEKRIISLDEVICASAVCVNVEGIQKCLEFPPTPAQVIVTRDPTASTHSSRVIVNVPVHKTCQ